MKLELLLFGWSLGWCFSIRLNPLENNDMLQGINNQYIAEWQWESWSMKENSSEQDYKTPGPRINVALWKDGLGPTWYLFGGESVDTSSKKIYSDVWKYSAKTRIWKRFFPSGNEVKGVYTSKIGGMMTLRATLFDDGHIFNSKPKNHNIILCGGTSRTNSSKARKSNIWNSFKRRKKQDDKMDELKSLAVYAPKTSKSNTVWQIDLKDKLWTAYVCCCDTSNSGKAVPKEVMEEIVKPVNITLSNNLKVKDLANITNKSKLIDFKINNAEDEIDVEQQHFPIDKLKDKKKKINQSKKINNDPSKKSKKIIKRSSNKVNHSSQDAKIQTETKETEKAKTETDESAKNKTKENLSIKKEKYYLRKKPAEIIKSGNLSESLKQNVYTNDSGERSEASKPKIAAKYCPEFPEDGEPVTWCDGINEALITVDIKLPEILLWIFNLKTSHWSQQQVSTFQEVTLAEGVEWPGCSNSSSIRYTGNEEEVYVVCTPKRKENDSTRIENNFESLAYSDATIKAVYRINYKKRVLESLGNLYLNPYFNSSEGKDLWQNDTKSILKVVQSPDGETILFLAYLDSVDMWILTKNTRGNMVFEIIEKVWRGSAQKWFSKYYAFLYNFQLVTVSEKSESILMPNPKFIQLDEYWPRDRGRFIIRILRNENLKNQSVDNKTREHNLTYQLLQSDYKMVTGDTQFYHTYSIKVLVFFGISIAIFAVFGFVVFLKRCVTCPRLRTRSECHKSPLIIRYSVIPDDMLYSLA